MKRSESAVNAPSPSMVATPNPPPPAVASVELLAIVTRVSVAVDCAAVASVAAPPARVEFEVPPGQMDLDITIEDAGSGVIDRETRKLEVPSLGLGLTLSTPQLFRARTLREWQMLAADPAAIPLPDREFRRTDHLLVRAAGQSAAGTAIVTARLLNRDGDSMTPLTTAPAAGGFTNIDVPLANLPTGEFLVEVTATDGTERTIALVAIRVTG